MNTKQAVWICLISAFLVAAAHAANFTTASQTAAKFGVHEIELTGNGSVANPFDTEATVTFTPPSGAAGAKTVHMFYDGGNTWRARAYVTEKGTWTWSSACPTDPALAGKKGAFTAADSQLKGMIRKHTANPRALMTDDGAPFFLVGDTAYYLLSKSQADWQDYVRDDWKYGITLMRCSVLGALRDWPHYWRDADTKDFFNLDRFKNDDARLQWMLDNYPAMYIELVMFPETNTGTGKDETLFTGLTAQQRARLLRFMVARYGAYPQVIWEIVNDYSFAAARVNNLAMSQAVGEFLDQNDPWHHLVTTGAVRNTPYPFGQAKWSSLIHLETRDAFNADQVQHYDKAAAPVFCGEDRYETYIPPADCKYFFRRLMWSWLLSGGYACYGGDWDAVTPYTATSMVGLNSVAHIKPYFEQRRIDMAHFTPDDSLATDPDRAEAAKRPHLTHRATQEYLVYLPNPDAKNATVDQAAAKVTLNLANAPGPYSVEWFRADDGLAQNGPAIPGGRSITLTAPWPAQDVVLRLKSSKEQAKEQPAANVKSSGKPK